MINAISIELDVEKRVAIYNGHTKIAFGRISKLKNVSLEAIEDYVGKVAHVNPEATSHEIKMIYVMLANEWFSVVTCIRRLWENYQNQKAKEDENLALCKNLWPQAQVRIHKTLKEFIDGKDS